MKMDRIKTYVINLPKDQKRRESILHETSQFSNLDVEIVKAIYGKELRDLEKERLFNDEKFRKYYRRMLLPGEIGSTLSHRKCYKHLLDSNRQFALILEDDAHFFMSPSDTIFWIHLEKIMNTEKPVVLLLQANANYFGKEKMFYENYTLYPVYSSDCATAYLINKNAARILLQEKRPYYVADDWFRFRKWGIDVYCVCPSVILQWDEFASSVLEEKRPYRKKRRFPHSWIECGLVYEKIVYLMLKKLDIVKHIQG